MSNPPSPTPHAPLSAPYTPAAYAPQGYGVWGPGSSHYHGAGGRQAYLAEHRFPPTRQAIPQRYRLAGRYRPVPQRPVQSRSHWGEGRVYPYLRGGWPVGRYASPGDMGYHFRPMSPGMGRPSDRYLGQQRFAYGYSWRPLAGRVRMPARRYEVPPLYPRWRATMAQPGWRPVQRAWATPSPSLNPRATAPNGRFARRTIDRYIRPLPYGRYRYRPLHEGQGRPRIRTAATTPTRHYRFRPMRPAVQPWTAGWTGRRRGRLPAVDSAGQRNPDLRGRRWLVQVQRGWRGPGPVGSYPRLPRWASQPADRWSWAGPGRVRWGVPGRSAVTHSHRAAPAYALQAPPSRWVAPWEAFNPEPQGMSRHRKGLMPHTPAVMGRGVSGINQAPAAAVHNWYDGRPDRDGAWYQLAGSAGDWPVLSQADSMAGGSSVTALGFPAPGSAGH